MPTTNRPSFANFFAAFRAHSALQKSTSSLHSPSTTSGTAGPTSAAGAAAAAYSSLSRSYHTSTTPDPHTQTQAQPSPIPAKYGPAIQPSSHSLSPSSAHATASVATAPPQSHFRSSRPLHPPNGTPQSRGRMRSSSREALPIHAPPPPPTAQSSEALALSPPFPSRTPSPGMPGYALPRGRRGSDSSAHSNGSGHRAAAGLLSPSPPPSGIAEKWYIGGRTAQGEERFYKLGLVRSSGSADRLSLDRLSL